MPSPLRAALVGYGLAGRVFHGPFLAAHPDVELVAVVTGADERARAASAAHPGARIVPGITDLADQQLDLIVLSGPPQTHRVHARWALQRDIAVVVDKPFMPSVADALEVIELAESRGGRLTVFHNRRWDGDFRGLQALATGSELGELFELESAFEHWDPMPRADWKHLLPVAQGGGVTMDLGSHLVDQAIVLLGPVTAVDADLRAVRPGAGNDDVAHLRLTHLSGARSTLRMSRLANQPAPRFRLSGTRGSVVVHGLDPQEGLLDSGTPVSELERVQRETARTAAVRTDAGFREEQLPTGDYAGFYAEAVSWLQGHGPVPVDPHSAVEVLRVLERATATLR